jgi:hypothetical protein
MKATFDSIEEFKIYVIPQVVRFWREEALTGHDSWPLIFGHETTQQLRTTREAPRWNEQIAAELTRFRHGA